MAAILDRAIAVNSRTGVVAAWTILGAYSLSDQTILRVLSGDGSVRQHADPERETP